MQEKAHLIGIGGIGMSALAQYLLDLGVAVSGSDKSESPTTELLRKKGVQVIIGHARENIPGDAGMVIYSDAVSPDNVERVHARELALPKQSYFSLLGKLTLDKHLVAVAGTHGKTTTTGMLTKILVDAGAKPTAIIGSIVKDFGSNYVRGEGSLFVLEACEYRDHLLELMPAILLITNLEWDHTDWFPSLEVLQDTFRKAIKKVPPEGYIVTNTQDPNIAPLLTAARAKVVDYTREPAYELSLPGEFNQANARAAAAAARVICPELSDREIRESLRSFQGTWRRFEYKGKTEQGAEVYDDYAHHPTAVRETLKALREKTKGRVFVAFHPHLYSRTRDLFNDFAAAFTDTDEVLIAPIYAAREADDGSVSSEMLAAAIAKNGVHARAVSFEEIEQILKTEPKSDDVVMTIGAGDIYKVADQLVQK